MKAKNILMVYIVMVKAASIILFSRICDISYIIISVAGIFAYIYALKECMSGSMDRVKRGVWWMVGLFVFHLLTDGLPNAWISFFTRGRTFLTFVGQDPWMAAVLVCSLLGWIFFLEVFIVLLLNNYNRANK